MSKREVAKAYREAAKVITERGWIQGALERSTGVCALGGLHRALIKSGLADRLFHEFRPGDTVYGKGTAAASDAIVSSDLIRKYSYPFTKDGNYHTVLGLNVVELENKVISKRFGDRCGHTFGGGIVDFNDSYANSAEEVKSVLRGVAAALEHGGKV